MRRSKLTGLLCEDWILCAVRQHGCYNLFKERRELNVSLSPPAHLSWTTSNNLSSTPPPSFCLNVMPTSLSLSRVWDCHLYTLLGLHSTLWKAAAIFMSHLVLGYWRAAYTAAYIAAVCVSLCISYYKYSACLTGGLEFYHGIKLLFSRQRSMSSSICCVPYAAYVHGHSSWGVE